MPKNRSLITDENYRFYHASCLDMSECEDNSVGLTITSPPYWNAIDYDTHTSDDEAWYRERNYSQPTLPIDDVFKRDIANSIWHIAPVPPKTIDHPCPFPDELVRRLVLLYSEEGDEILDPFLGSGQTARGALRFKRKCVGYEIESKYIELTCQRLYEEPGRKYHLLPKVEKQKVLPEDQMTMFDS